MGWEAEYKESEIVEDHTQVLSKIWDNLMPATYPYVLEFKTKKAVEIHKVKKMGPYHMTERYIDYDCYVLIDGEPLHEIGWTSKRPITKQESTKAYGGNYFDEMRFKMVELSKYAGLGIKSSFDFGGQLIANVED